MLHALLNKRDCNRILPLSLSLSFASFSCPVEQTKRFPKKKKLNRQLQDESFRKGSRVGDHHPFFESPVAGVAHKPCRFCFIPLLPSAPPPSTISFFSNPVKEGKWVFRAKHKKPHTNTRASERLATIVQLPLMTLAEERPARHISVARKVRQMFLRVFDDGTRQQMILLIAICLLKFNQPFPPHAHTLFDRII